LASYSGGCRATIEIMTFWKWYKLQLLDGTATSGRWVIEGDLSSYFDTVHHKLLMKCIRKRIRDPRFLSLLWRFIKVGHIDKGLFTAASKGVPQGGVISPLLSNIMLNEFDQWLDVKYLGNKARKDRWYWNRTIKDQRPIALSENRQWQPAVTYCRYADDFVIIIKGNKAQVQGIREACRCFLENDLKLTLNMEKTKITHINDGITFLGHHIIRKRGPKGTMRPVSNIPIAKFRQFAHKLVKELSGNYSVNTIDMIDSLNRKLAGWASFYQFTDYTAMTFGKLDRIIFWKLAKWLARKYRTSIKGLMIKWVRSPSKDKAKIWVISGWSGYGKFCKVALRRLVTSRKMQFKWRLPEINPYITRIEERNTITSSYNDVAMAMSHT